MPLCNFINEVHSRLDRTRKIILLLLKTKIPKVKSMVPFQKLLEPFSYKALQDPALLVVYLLNSINGYHLAFSTLQATIFSALLICCLIG